MRLQDEIMSEVKDAALSSWDVVYALNMSIACLVAYWIMTDVLSRFVDGPSDFSGGTVHSEGSPRLPTVCLMRALAATIFVFRDTGARSLSAGTARLIATCVSFAGTGIMILVAGHALVSASARKVNGHDLAFRVFALQIGGIEQKRYTEDGRSADHGRAHVGAS
jgi:hypothetical protein